MLQGLSEHECTVVMNLCGMPKRGLVLCLSPQANMESHVDPFQGDARLHRTPFGVLC